jgi:beta-galactosidase
MKATSDSSMDSSHSVACLMIMLIVTLTQSAVAVGARGNEGPSTGLAREMLLLDVGWKFHLGDAAAPEHDFDYGTGEAFAKAGAAVGAVQPEFNDSSWRIVDLPHDWAVELDVVNVMNDDLKDHGYKPLGRQFPKSSIGWYRRTFAIPKTDEGKRLAVKFDGVSRDCIVWFNGHYLGRNMSGFGEFVFDITDYARYGEKNKLVVRVDATQYEGWFYEGAGIYRHTWLMKTAPLHIPLYGAFVWTDVESRRALVTAETMIVNDQDMFAQCTLTLLVRDEDGKTVGKQRSASLTLAPFEHRAVRHQIEVRNHILWSLEQPYLYTLVSLVQTGEQIVDKTETAFGIRTIRFDNNNGFFLNGKRVEIRGVCCHQDHAGVGSALPDRLQYYRIGKLKEMGCNAYRTSHNPPTPALLDACDRVGMLVMDENRIIGSSPEMLQQCEALILRDRNHPSVILWSLGNEEWVIQNNDIGRRLALSLRTLQRRLDPTRVCTYAANNGNQYEGINSIVDVRGINYIVYCDADKYHRDHPDQPLVGSEEASTLCTRGMYANDTVNGFMSDYDVNAPAWGSIAEKWWRYYAPRPWLAGAFVWTGFDYRGEPTPYRWPCISSHFGIMDVCGFPKNNYYYYQSWWSDKDVLHIAPHWNWPGRQGQTIDVWCQSNCDSVELFLNGKSLGRKTMEPNSHLEWNVAYAPGTLEACGWRSGRLLRDREETTGIPASLSLAADRPSVSADGEDVCCVTVEALDARGRYVPVADNLVHFELNGEGKIIGVGNGNPSSHEADTYLDGKYQRRLFNGKCQVILQSTRRGGTMVLTASAEGMKTASLTVKAEACRPRPFVE